MEIPAPPSTDYVPGPEHPPSLDYVPGPEEPEQAPLSPDYIPEPEYPEYLAPSDAEAPMKDQPLPDDASPTALSPGYVAAFDPEEDLTDYPADGGDDVDDESSDDDDDHEEEQEASDDHDEEEEHPALTDSSVVPIDDPLPSTEDTKAFETDESAATPVPSPRRRMARMSVRPQTPMSAATKALIVAVAAVLPLSPPPSPLTSLSSSLPQIPSPPLPVPSPLLPPPSPPTYTSLTYVEAPLGYRAAEIRSATAARQPVLDVATVDATPRRLMSREVGYGIEDVWDDMTQLTTAIGRIQILEAREPARTDDPKDVDSSKIKANRTSRNGDDSHDLGTGSRRTKRAAHETVGHDVAYAMIWKTLKKMMTDKYCPMELALMCSRMFPEESDEVEKYIGGLPDMIQRSVMASNPKKIQDAIEFTTELMDQKIRTLAERQAKTKRKSEVTSRNNQN
ncbi:hypothetical protein Tco_0337735 [Tanacetum coccineum]